MHFNLSIAINSEHKELQRTTATDTCLFIKNAIL